VRHPQLHPGGLDAEGNAAAQENIKEITTAANRAKDLVQQILTFGRQREQERQRIRLDVVVKEAANGDVPHG